MSQPQHSTDLVLAAQELLVQRNFPALEKLLGLREIEIENRDYVRAILPVLMYDSATYNESMLAFFNYIIEEGDLEILGRFHPDVEATELSRAIEFDNFALVKRILQGNLAYFSGSNNEIFRALDRCSNPQLICYFFRFGSLDLRFPGELNFLQREEPEFVEIVRFLHMNENLEQRQRHTRTNIWYFCRQRILPPGDFSRDVFLQHFLERALHHENRPVCHYLLSSGIRPRTLPTSHTTQRLIALYEANYEFLPIDYSNLPSVSTKQEILTVKTLALSTILNVLPNEIHHRLFTVLIV